jgi:hypothetical protein
MAEKLSKQKAKSKREPESVLGSLPATRPERLGRPRAGATATVAAKPRRPKATTAAPPTKTASVRAPRPKVVRTATAATAAPGPAAVSPGCPQLEGHARTDPPAEAVPIGAPRGTELVTTAIRATGELAQIGFSVGGRALKRAVTRLPHP